MSLFTPEGEPVRNIERLILLSMWAAYLSDNQFQPEIIFAGLGRPTYPVNLELAEFNLNYWRKLLNRSKQARDIITHQGINANTRNAIVQLHAAINYGSPPGQTKARAKIANALTQWYNNKVQINWNNILFTVGGVNALFTIFQLINQSHPRGRIVTPFPYYTLYHDKDYHNHLHPIHVMQEKGYRLTATALIKSIKTAEKLAKTDRHTISAFLFCDPNNPLGTVVGKNEWHKIAEVLRNYPHVPIVLDEAYAEMCFQGRHVSLLQVAPDLKERIILLRSATKALSAAGERMGIMIAFNQTWITKLTRLIIDHNLHAPIGSQMAYAIGLSNLNEQELSNYTLFYKPQVDYVVKRFKKMHISLPDPQYKIKSTFYVIGDFSDFIGLDLPQQASQALGKKGKIRTDEDIAYFLLFEAGVMLAPLSYFGLDPKLGYLRATCSGGDQELKTLMDRLEQKLSWARKLSLARDKK